MCEKRNSTCDMRQVRHSNRTRPRPESGGSGGGGGGGAAPSALIANRKAEPKNESHPRNNSRNKISSPIRNGLENALVALCDVWFEEIKPHLVRHGIKVHCGNDDARAEAGGGGGGGASASTHLTKLFRQPATFPHSNIGRAATCSHLEPGESAAHCELCRLLSGACAGIERASAQAALAPAAAAFAAPSAYLVPGT